MTPPPLDASQLGKTSKKGSLQKLDVGRLDEFRKKTCYSKMMQFMDDSKNTLDDFMNTLDTILENLDLKFWTPFWTPNAKHGRMM